jgi:hypothetical protein
MIQLYELGARVTSLPAFSVGEGQRLLQCRVCRTIHALMEDLLARCAGLMIALGTVCFVRHNVLRGNKSAAFYVTAVDSITSVVFLLSFSESVYLRTRKLVRNECYINLLATATGWKHALVASRA